MLANKDKILAILLKAKGYISGEEISKSLGISRTAVNTAVKALRCEGCEIQSLTNKGYKIINSPDNLSVGKIMSHLSKERVGDIVVLDTVNSTNTFLKELSIRGKASYGDCIIANEQTSGKGRLGRTFSSVADKGIYLSYLINPKSQSPFILSQITAWGAVAVRDAIFEICGISPEIKWVNDLVCGNKKLCGILTEMSVVGESAEAENVVIGIGINVSHSSEDFPDEIKDIATSVEIITQKKTDRAKLCASIIEKLDKLVSDFPENKKYYLDEYRKSCAIIGKKIRIIKNSTEILGTALDIDDNFGLKVIFDDGKEEVITGGEVSVRGFYGYV